MARRSRAQLAVDARAALAKADAGRALNRNDRSALEQVRRDTGAKRDLTSYSPRTRRRYLSAFSNERTAHDQYANEYRQRVRRAVDSRAAIDRDYSWLSNHLSDWGDRFGEEDLEDAIAVYGEAQIARRLSRERQSTLLYMHGDSRHGNHYWTNRDLQPLRGMDISDFQDPMFYYHGRQS